jgi:hypothetical protein
MIKSKSYDYLIYAYIYSLNRDVSLKIYLNAARWISLAIHPYANLTAVFFTGLEEDMSEEDRDVRQSSEM